MIFICWQIVRINQFQKYLIIKERPNSIPHHTHPCTHTLPVRKIRISILKRRHVGNPDKKPKETAIEHTITPQPIHEGRTAHTDSESPDTDKT